MRNLIYLLFFCLSGCNPPSESVQKDGVRIVSFSPGITNTLIDSGYGEQIVGRSSFCFYADQSIPVVGDLLTIDYERLLRLSPTHVFVQQTTAGIDEHLLALATQANFELHAWSLDSIADIQLMFSEITELLGSKRLEFEIPNVNNNSVPEPILVIMRGMEGGAGLSFGQGTYIDDLMQMMKLENALNQSLWVSLSLEDIGRLNPKLIVVVSDVAIPEGSLIGVRSLGIPVLPFVHKHVLVPSSYIDDVATEFQEMLNNL